MCLSYQNHRGRSTSTEVWVFGLADTSQSPALGYMEVVHQWDAATLLPIIHAHVALGAFTFLDSTPVIDGLKSELPMYLAIAEDISSQTDPRDCMMEVTLRRLIFRTGLKPLG